MGQRPMPHPISYTVQDFDYLLKFWWVLWKIWRTQEYLIPTLEQNWHQIWIACTRGPARNVVSLSLSQIFFLAHPRNISDLIRMDTLYHKTFEKISFRGISICFGQSWIFLSFRNNLKMEIFRNTENMYLVKHLNMYSYNLKISVECLQNISPFPFEGLSCWYVSEQQSDSHFYKGDIGLDNVAG